MLQYLVLGFVGLAGLLSGAKITVDGSKSVAKKLGISEFFIGLTILSIGTSLPEIFTHVIGALKILKDPTNILMLSGITVGTNIGSNIIQITLITGIAGLVATIHLAPPVSAIPVRHCSDRRPLAALWLHVRIAYLVWLE